VAEDVTFQRDLVDARSASAALTPPELDLILGGNIARLLKLKS
jgi:hypothetical protein